MEERSRPVQLQHLIDRMIDQANESDPEGSYNILIGTIPATETGWVEGKKIYRWCPVIQTRLIPNYVVVLAPCPDNLRHHDLVEYRGGIPNGDVAQHTIRRRLTPSKAVPLTSLPEEPAFTPPVLGPPGSSATKAEDPGSPLPKRK